MSETRSRRIILLVEDDQDVRALYAEVLRSEGYCVVEAENGSAALSILEIEDMHVHAILTDLRMPVMDGLAFARTLKGRAQFSTIPIVLLTATPIANAWHAREYFAALLTKPCALSLLLSTIDAL